VLTAVLPTHYQEPHVEPKLVAQANMHNLSVNPYPGRGLVIGKVEPGWIQVYWIMGRSEDSRNRVFTQGADGLVYTEAVDPSKVKDPSLIIYNAMAERNSFFFATNGVQTDNLVDAVTTGTEPTKGLRQHTYEPDPNHTSRISGWCTRDPNSYAHFSLIKKSPLSAAADRHLFKCEVEAGYGYGISTYRGDGSPLPAFKGEPQLLPIEGTIEEIAQTYWSALNEANRVSLAVKLIPYEIMTPSQVHIINKYEKVA
jgi:IMP cyclohydrolase